MPLLDQPVQHLVLTPVPVRALLITQTIKRGVEDVRRPDPG